AGGPGGGGRSAGGPGGGGRSGQGGARSAADLRRRGETLMVEIERDETRIAEILSIFAEPGFYDRADESDVERLQGELEAAKRRVAKRMAEWEATERDLASAEAR
ncbi:MAG: hypothetical protein RQ745_04240, partial [Longimicrobiales bacterium]|nr:hypothetical protein [Longimicrobiales bacterium]